MGKQLSLLLVALMLTFGPQAVWAGPVFLTGHDPDFHAQSSAGAQDLLKAGLNFATGGTYNVPGNKFLWVEALPSDFPAGIPGGHLIGEKGLEAIGLAPGINFDQVDASGLPTAIFSHYTAIAVASTFGGLLRQQELNALIARSADIATFINGGGGLMALAECFPSSGSCLADLLVGPSPGLFGYLPVTVSSIPPTAPFNPTAAGAGPPFNLTFGDLNDPTHNSFGLIGGLTPLDLDSGSPHQATTLAGTVTIGGGGFTPTPEPSSLLLLSSGLAGFAGLAWRRSRDK